MENYSYSGEKLRKGTLGLCPPKKKFVTVLEPASISDVEIITAEKKVYSY